MAGRQGELPLDLGIFLCFAIYSASHAFKSHLPAAARGAWADVPAVHCDGAVVGH
jgi:hypothetical protein